MTYNEEKENYKLPTSKSNKSRFVIYSVHCTVYTVHCTAFLLKLVTLFIKLGNKNSVGKEEIEKKEQKKRNGNISKAWNFGKLNI